MSTKNTTKRTYTKRTSAAKTAAPAKTTRTGAMLTDENSGKLIRRAFNVHRNKVATEARNAVKALFASTPNPTKRQIYLAIASAKVTK